MILSIFALQLYLDQFGGDKGAALDFAKSRGISTVEIFDSELEDITLHDYCKLVEEHGLTISTVIRVSKFPAKEEEVYEAEMACIKSLIDDVAKEGIGMIMVVPAADYVKTEEDKLFMRDKIIQGMKEVMAYAEGTGVTIMTENFSRADYPFGTIEEMRYILDNVPGMKYNFDTGNFYFRYCDVLEAYETLKDRIVNVHIKDWKNDENGEFDKPNLPKFTGAAIGDGVLPMGELIDRLKADGYEGQLVVEINPVAETTQMIDDSIAFIKSKLTKTPLEYGVMAVEALMHQHKAQELPPVGSFFYTQGVCLWGVQQIYQLTKDKRYFNYIKDYVDSVLAPDGSIYGMVHELGFPSTSKYAVRCLTMLDCKQPSVLLHLLYDETGDEKYMKGIKAVAESLYYYPVNKYGGYWHMMTQPYQMWLDGSYMAGLLSVMYAKRFGDNTLRERAVKQILIMHDHMRDEKTGLYYHAWDDSKQMPWADPETGLSPQFWGRGMGWYPAAVMDILEYLPKDHPEAETLKNIVREVFEAIVKYQDAESGMWYEVLDQPGREGNWLESSVTQLFCYAFVKARRMGVIGGEYDEIIERTYRGIIGNCYMDEEGYLVIDNVCLGACVDDGSYEYYINRPKGKNDMHAIGSFCFLMAEIERCKKELGI